jgi:hypothetical protein
MGRIVLQNSKVAAVQIFGENLKRKEVDDSHSFSRATEVAHEFGARRRGPSDHYTKNAPAAPRIFDTSCKATFATLSSEKQTSLLFDLRLAAHGAKQPFLSSPLSPTGIHVAVYTPLEARLGAHARITPHLAETMPSDISYFFRPF